jgi:cytoskeletal protein CcmA (bactofilin family)
MWENSHTQTRSIPPPPEPARVAPVLAVHPTVARAAVPVGAQSTLGKGITLIGEISCSEPLESLYIDGSVQGSINLPGCRVTVGNAGQVTANISAQDIVVLGKVRGNVTASNRVDIRAQGAMVGEVSAPRVSIEDGAFFKGSLEVRKIAAKPVAAVEIAPIPMEAPTALLAQAEFRNNQQRHRSLQSA